MIVIPSLELRDGELVRPGTNEANDVLGAARDLRRHGALMFHLQLCDDRAAEQMARMVDDMVPFQVGGPGCEPDRVPELMKAGADRVVLPTTVLADAGQIGSLAERYGIRMLVELDFADGRVRTGDEGSGLELSAAVQTVVAAGIGTVVLHPADDSMDSVACLEELLGGGELEVFLRASVTSEEELSRLRGFAEHGLRGLLLDHSLCAQTLELAAQLDG